MATASINLSAYDKAHTPSGKDFSIAIVWAEWNTHITRNLLHGAHTTLLELGVPAAQIEVHSVPGSYELPCAALWLAESGRFNAIITIGSVIQGETRHFEFVCQAVAQGVKDVSLKTSIPVIFCVLTDDTEQQAMDRSGGRHGNKGVEAAVAAVKMAHLKRSI